MSQIEVVASLPIRNWNEEKKNYFAWNTSSCEPTYKELKRRRKNLSAWRNFSCEPTYKELKHLLLSYSAFAFAKLRAYL